VDNAVQNTLRLLETVGRTDIPVFRGCGQSIIAPTMERENYYGCDGFGDLEYETPVDSTGLQEEHAVNAWHKFALKYPKQISLILIGPLTNYAICSTMYSDFNQNLKDIYAMGGNWRGRGNVTKSGEFNF
uniref:Inosine/uridine-preferring nucleoside hydrolase domain-containing protein n=1 Tax=Megaselia scalaris TaxID=36166 RepID=T1H560_MEGSC